MLCLLFALIPASLTLQQDTVRVGTGSRELDGLKYHDHFLATTITRSHGDTTLGKLTFAIDVRHVTREGRPVVDVRVGPLPDQPDPGIRITTILDPRTTLPIHYHAETPNGALIDLAFEGSHIAGVRRAGADSAEQKIDVTLPEPAFLGAYEDAALDAMPLRVGEVLRVPVLPLSVGGVGDVKSYFYRVVRKDTVAVNGHQAPAWVVEAQDSLNTNTIWLIDEPPYTFRWLRVSARGRVTDLTQVVRAVKP
jgi:hypothetical protein